MRGRVDGEARQGKDVGLIPLLLMIAVYASLVVLCLVRLLIKSYGCCWCSKVLKGVEELQHPSIKRRAQDTNTNLVLNRHRGLVVEVMAHEGARPRESNKGETAVEQ